MGTPRRSTFLKLFRGKFRRFRLAHTRRGREYIRRMERLRHGECSRCGACCRLAYRCQFLRMEGDVAACRFHNLRPANCRIFPLDPLDLADRDLVSPDRPCGFSFRDEPAPQSE